MDLQPLTDWCLSFYEQHTIFCYVLAAVATLVALWKPVKVLKTTALALVLIIIVYICFTIVDSMLGGMSSKDKAIHRTEKAIE